MDRLKKYIEHTIAPKIQGDGGWIELRFADEEAAEVVLRGECSKCAIADRCMTWVAAEIKRDLGINVTVCATRRKPFFWDV